MSSDEHSGGSSANMPASASGSMAGHSAPDPMIGQQIGRYRIFAKLGEGGMGEVYAAEHVTIHKKVAIKLLRPEITSNEEAMARFEQEAISSSKLGHKNIIGIDDFGTLPDGRVFLSMELLEGQPLNDMLEQPMDPVRLLYILIQACHGLKVAHEGGIVHRDMKPENIFVTTGDVPKLLDFGIAKVAQGEGQNHLTRTGTIFGTPFYMAPEQALGHSVDHRADIYALGVIMYECFCGSVPFQGESFMGILTQHITTPPMDPRQMAHQHGRSLLVHPDSNRPGVAEIIIRCMAKEPDQRYQTMAELITDLGELYRALGGAGASIYMEAQGQPPVMYAPSGMHQSMPTPPPSPAIPPSQATMAAPSGSYASGGHVQPSGGYATDASQSFVAPAKKGKGGIIIVILALLLVGGGVGGFLWWQSQQGETTAGAGDGDGKGAGGETGDPKDNPLAGGDKDGGDDKPATTADAAPTQASTPDAGAVAASPDAAPKVETVIVVINSKPQGAAVYRDGKKLDEVTPTNISVNKGEKVELVLRKRGRKDETLVVDGSKTKVTAKLARERTGGTTTKPDPGNGGQDPVKLKRCSPQWCKIPANKSEMCCQLE